MIFENGNYLTYPNKSGVTNYSLQNDFVGYDKSVCTEKATAKLNRIWCSCLHGVARH